MSANRTILFLCPHHAAKSILAEAYCRRSAARRGVAIEVTSAGTDPEPAVSPAVVRALLAEGIDVSDQHPRRVDPADLASAWRIVSLGCDPADFGPTAAPVERWDDVPPPSQGMDAACVAIAAHVDRLLDDISGVECPSPVKPPER